MPTSTLVLPSNFIGDLWTSVTNLFSALSPITIVIITILVVSVVIEIIVGAIRGR